jgi:hypothetical protein
LLEKVHVAIWKENLNNDVITYVTGRQWMALYAE